MYEGKKTVKLWPEILLSSIAADVSRKIPRDELDVNRRWIVKAFLQKSLNFNCFNGTEGTWLRTPCHVDEKHLAEKSNSKKPGYSLFLRLIELKPYMGSSSTLKLRGCD